MAKTLAELLGELNDARRRTDAFKAARGVLSNAGMQTDAAVRGAANAMTFGLADRMAAVADTTFHPGTSYDENLQKQTARTDYDHDNRRPAQLVGEAAGTAVGLAAAGPIPKLLQARRMAGAAAITGREVASALGAGATAGAGVQGLSDLASRRAGTAGDYLGAAAGGAIGVAALPLGVRRAGALSGGTTAAAQDLLNGRPVSPETLQQSATAGAVLGGLGARVAGQWSSALSRKAKGELGEAMGRIRSVSDWRPRDPSRYEQISVEGGRKGAYSIPDGRRGEVVYEDKFGPRASLNKNQRLLRSQKGDQYVINHFLPRDVGAISSVPAAMAGPQVGPLQRRRP